MPPKAIYFLTLHSGLPRVELSKYFLQDVAGTGETVATYAFDAFLGLQDIYKRSRVTATDDVKLEDPSSVGMLDVMRAYVLRISPGSVSTLCRFVSFRNDEILQCS